MTLPAQQALFCPCETNESAERKGTTMAEPELHVGWGTRTTVGRGSGRVHFKTAFFSHPCFTCLKRKGGTPLDPPLQDIQILLDLRGGNREVSTYRTRTLDPRFSPLPWYSPPVCTFAVYKQYLVTSHLFRFIPSGASGGYRERFRRVRTALPLHFPYCVKSS